MNHRLPLLALLVAAPGCITITTQEAFRERIGALEVEQEGPGIEALEGLELQWDREVTRWTARVRLADGSLWEHHGASIERILGPGHRVSDVEGKWKPARGPLGRGAEPLVVLADPEELPALGPQRVCRTKHANCYLFPVKAPNLWGPLTPVHAIRDGQVLEQAEPIGARRARRAYVVRAQTLPDGGLELQVYAPNRGGPWHAMVRTRLESPARKESRSSRWRRSGWKLLQGLSFLVTVPIDLALVPTFNWMFYVRPTGPG